ncbi:polysaccharide pyruvyl transferase family protein [Sphingobium sp. CAP-1]|uniref:polysaccharide pyruvyl transferase family protein n=1 Tax=Sphingobium sp. CAP-1 TaxID=2676077 RepID=UPI0012BB2B83|nr:polysaccharide pyruvyl transferase family protein [Sphingobium sp. CAP-1]QGP79587.1 hypothetical protein GL174_11805 [Sphingobium sp. CAP-1]
MNLLDSSVIKALNGSRGQAMAIPTIISFYAGANYYHAAADRLAADCEALGLEHDIVELQKPDDLDWSQICRMKIPFYEQMLAKHSNGILWVDVDTRIIRRPEALSGGNYDFGAFVRNFKNFRDFDPAIFGRRFHPGFLHFTATEVSRQFVSHLAALERGSSANATDDYFLEEAFRSFEPGLGIHLFSSDLIAFSGEEGARRERVSFVHGSSGNVSDFIDRVEQHHADAFVVGRERASLLRQFRAAAKRGRRDEAEAIIRAALRLDNSHQDTAVQAAKYFLRLSKPRSALQCLRAAFDMRTAPPEALMVSVEANLAIDDLAGVRIGLRRLARTGLHEEFRRSRQFRLELEERAQKLGFEAADRPQLWWMEQPYPGNFGDALNPYIVEKLSGIPPRFVPKGEGILAIGSVIKFAKAGTSVWGTGTPRMTDPLSPDATYHAVRGPLTRQLVLESGGQAPTIYGDAAMLLPLIKAPAPQRHRLGLIRHYTHVDQPLVVADDVLEINLVRVGYDDMEAFIDEVTSCEAIISTSLHGLIVAHAYGVPTRRAIFSASGTQIPGDGTKFSDHYQAFGIQEADPLDLSLHATLNGQSAALCTEVVTKPLRARLLLEVAPFAILPEFMEKAAEFERKSSFAGV